jgi:hypothetical protein
MSAYPPSHDDVGRKRFEDRHQALERAASEADSDTALQGVARKVSM